MKNPTVLLLLLLQNLLFSQEQWDIRFYNVTQNREVFILADNNEEMPMSARFDFTLNNLSSSLPTNETVIIPPKTAKFLIAKLTPINAKAANSFSYNTTYNFGNALQEVFEADYVYSLPFEKGKTQRIFQGYNGKFSHQNSLALDFDLKEGSPVFAARDGIVVQVVNHNTRSCPDISCAKYNNKILIMHRDGTFADYSHLKFRGTAVKKGDMVEKDQLIGYSGSTGFASGPHLHFAVFINRLDGKRTFVETKFRTATNEAEILEEGKNYTKNY